LDVDPKKVEVILDSADTNLFMPRSKDNSEVEHLRSALGIKKGARVVLYAGSFSALQGTDLLLQAMKQVLEQEKDLFFVLVGGRWSKDYESYIRTAGNLGISSHVKFMPGVSYIRTLPYLLNLADVAVAPKRFSLQSHGKLAVLMASGLPTVVFDNRINRLFLDSLGIYAKEADAEVFAEAIISGVNKADNDNLREKLRERAVRYFSLQRLVNDMQRVYEKVAG
jgi:glycosyltransferase involved in cell wall biosynthesis